MVELHLGSKKSISAKISCI
ncbi:hypothetical protein FWK35_00010592 [Aphis craccivora]|uniref:Uncharacterized protein n=1 Tax=Aphis craccivora TaxID=307492 RepID=A0A6G0YRI9_APHCR|nr:hypothetical protein FWK35_00010592 [Aphis craccivora]